MRQTSLTPQPDAPLRIDLDLVRDEPRRLVIDGAPTAQLVMTISATEDGAPLIEIPATGTIEVTPALVQTLKEGAPYHFNIWDRDNAALLVKGKLTLANSIRPSGADVATIFLEAFGQPYGPSKVVALSASDYGALQVKDFDALYIVR